jgi:PAS domain S-box-containing protein
MVYAIVSWIWISVSDTLVHLADFSPRVETAISIAKGSIFVAGTALLIYWLLRLANGELAHANRAEDARTESEQRFRMLADNAPVLVWMSTRDADCDYFNKEWLRFTGRDPEQEMGMGWTAGVHGEDIQRYLKTYQDAFSARLTFTVEYRLRRHDGQYRWVLNNGVPRFTEAGAFAGYIGSCVDISGQKEAEAALSSANAMLLRRTQDATARLAAIVEGSEDAIIGYRLDGVITDWNQAATRLYGYSAEEAIGQDLSIIVPPSRTNEFRLILNTLAAGERIQQVETVRRRKDGSLMDVSFSASPIVGQAGTIIGGSGIVRDITSRKRMEEALRRSEERFRLVARATRDAISDWDIEGGAIWRSDGYWEQFGYSAMKPEPSMTDWKQLIHPEDQNRVWNGFHAALARHADSHEVEFRFRRADDSYAIVLDRTHIVYSKSGEPTRAISTMTDLSDRRELEEQFRQAQKMEAVGRLAGGVAHDFNNLLMIISGYADMMREQLPPDDKHRKNLGQVLKAADRAAALTQQLLAFSRKQVLSPRVIGLNAVVEDSLKIIQRLIGEDVELNVSLGKPLSPIKADPGQIVQVLMNLCVNARDAMRNGGELAIRTENVSIDFEAARKRPALVPGNYTALVVSDTGIGMTKEIQTHLFEPFFTTKESGRGTGLGLSTVYGVVKQSGGYIWVDSELGRGSSFSIYFPAVDAPLTPTVTPEIKKAEGQGEIILLVEDEEALRESISTYLALHGYRVLEASNGVQASQIASQYAGSIQVLITDIILPKLGGVELAREVAKTSPQAATLYMSGYSDRELIDYDPATSAAGFLQKPFALQILLRKLQEMIAERK